MTEALTAVDVRERTFVPAVHNLLDTIREGHPDTPLLLITPIFCPNHEDGFGPSLFRNGVCTSPVRNAEVSVGALNLARVRQVEADIVATRRAQGDENLHLRPLAWADGGPLAGVGRAG